MLNEASRARKSVKSEFNNMKSDAGGDVIGQIGLDDERSGYLRRETERTLLQAAACRTQIHKSFHLLLKIFDFILQICLIKTEN